MFPVQEKLHLGNTIGSKLAVEEAVSSVGWVQQLAGFPALSESPFLCMVLVQRRLAVCKELVTTVMITALVNIAFMSNHL